MNNDLDMPITLEELHRALLAMGPCKSPGLDGIPMELYRDFWDVIGEPYFYMISEALASQTLSPSVNASVMKLIPKGIPGDSFRDWRPLSLSPQCFLQNHC